MRGRWRSSNKANEARLSLGIIGVKRKKREDGGTLEKCTFRIENKITQ
jgi:hypothetical protein